jgi:exopolyphosphatase / guanosine-5'-triphosphate,3'-diphosphate pyrophosphatase
VIRHLRPATVVLSSLGVREGYLHTLLAEEERAKDPLLEAAEEFNVLRSRSPVHARELVEFSRRTFETLGLDETPNEERLRAAACLLSDVGWRAHPDYRGSQSLSMLTHAALSAVDHAGRAYLGLANYYRHEGDFEQTVVPEIHGLAGARLMEKARHIAALFRVAYILTASTPGILPRLRWRQDPRGGFTLLLPSDLAGLVSEKPIARLDSFSRILSRKLRLDVG